MDRGSWQKHSLKHNASEDGSFDLAGFKIVYIAPMKAEGPQTLNVAGHGLRMMDVGGF